ncbi:MAG: hypothetical protein ABI995_06800 [Acidobacteriota bacterium]
MTEEPQPVSLNFTGTLAEMVKWFLLWLLAALVVIPTAWVTAAAAQWFCSKLVFSDGTTAEFRGTGGDVVVWHIFLVLTIGAAIYLHNWFLLGALVIVAVIAVMLIKWFVYNLRLSSGPPLTFVGGRIKGQGVVVEFTGSWADFSWRSMAALCGYVPILTIPIAKLWYVRWLISQTVLRRGVDTSWEDFTKKKARPKRSSKAVPENYGPIA